MNAVELIIRLDPVRGLQISGPIHDRVLCYGLLELAKDAVRSYDSGKGGQRIVPAGPLLVPPAKPPGT